MLLDELLPTLQLRILNIEQNSPASWWRFKNVNSPFSRLFVVLKGETTVYHHQRKYTVTAGQMMLVPCFVTADYYCPESFEQIFIHFSSRLAGDIDLFNIQEYEYLLNANEDEIHFFHQLLKLNPNRPLKTYNPYISTDKSSLKNLDTQPIQSPSATLQSDGIFRQLLASYLKTEKKITKSDESVVLRFRPVFEYIEKHLKDPVHLQDLATVAGLNPTYFSDTFYAVTGFRPIEYIIRKRLEKAQLLLLSSSLSVKEICFETGFSSFSYFCRTFKKHTNLTPKAYRQSQFA